MNRIDCRLTFTEALEKYLMAREKIAEYKTMSPMIKEALELLKKEASEHMDALTYTGEEVEGLEFRNKLFQLEMALENAESGIRLLRKDFAEIHNSVHDLSRMTSNAEVKGGGQ